IRPETVRKFSIATFGRCRAVKLWRTLLFICSEEGDVPLKMSLGRSMDQWINGSMVPFSLSSLKSRRFAIVLTCIVVCWARSPLICQTVDPNTASHFAYDMSTPLDLRQVSTEKHGTVTVQEITYISPVGGVVPASLVVPNDSGKFAAVIWGHWLMPNATNSNKSEFLQEAIALASAGVVSLLIDAPQARPGFKASPNPALVAQQVIDLRRALDLLL